MWAWLLQYATSTSSTNITLPYWRPLLFDLAPRSFLAPSRTPKVHNNNNVWPVSKVYFAFPMNRRSCLVRFTFVWSTRLFGILYVELTDQSAEQCFFPTASSFNAQSRQERPIQALAINAKRVEQYMRSPWDQKGAEGFQMVPRCASGDSHGVPMTPRGAKWAQFSVKSTKNLFKNRNKICWKIHTKKPIKKTTLKNAQKKKLKHPL